MIIVMDEQIWDEKTNSYVMAKSQIKKKKGFWYFSKQEKIDLLVSWVTLSIAFTLVLINFDLTSTFTGSTFYSGITVAFPVALLAVGTGFVFHELAHRQAARHFGFVSEYRAWYQMLVLAIVFAFFTGFILAAPGATYFFGRNVTRKQNGIISVAGPATNVVLGLIFMIFAIFFTFGLLSYILVATATINFFFALFNLLPIWILDGKKVLAWNPFVWFVTILIPAIFILPMFFL